MIGVPYILDVPTVETTSPCKMTTAKEQGNLKGTLLNAFPAFQKPVRVKAAFYDLIDLQVHKCWKTRFSIKLWSQTNRLSTTDTL